MGLTCISSIRVFKPERDLNSLLTQVDDVDGFAGVYPEHKHRIVEALQRKGRLVGMTGDGVNDAPALKKANVGIAVAGATAAAKGAADIILTEVGSSNLWLERIWVGALPRKDIRKGRASNEMFRLHILHPESVFVPFDGRSCLDDERARQTLLEHV